MSLNLQKGQRVDLTKTNPGLILVGIGLGWDEAPAGAAFDLDAFAFIKKNGAYVVAEENILYFNSPKVGGKPTILAGALIHSGDNLTGNGDGDDEVIMVDLSKIPADVEEIAIGVNIYQANSRNQNFGMVNNSFIRLFDEADAGKKEIMKYDLQEDYSVNTGVIMGKLYRKDGEWRFAAIGQGSNGSITDICGTIS